MKHPFYPSSFVITHVQKVALVTGVLSFIAGGLLGWTIVPRAHPETLGNILSDDEALTATTTSLGSVGRGIAVFQGENEAVRVTDQKAGNKVFVAGVVLSEPAWVAVREEVDGEPGRILGAQWFAAGSSSGAITLLRGTKSGARYHAYLLHDNGDKRFDLTNDVPITENGLLILTPFTTY